VRRSYEFRIYPTAGQACRAAQCLRDHQRLYNAALEERREAWRMGKVSIRYGQQSAQLKDIRALDQDQGRWSFSGQQATLRRLDKAMAAFCRRCKAGDKRAGYPRFKALASGTLGRPGTGVAAKSGLNKSILDAGWSQFASILAGKAEEAARRVVFVNPACTSIDCHQCGRRCTRPQQDTVICPVHGGMDADVNGALNIYARAGLGSRRADAA
jgi:transposase